MFPLNRPEVANTAADVSSHLLGNIIANYEPAVSHCFLRRGNRVMNKGAHLARLFLFDVIKRIEVLDFAGKFNRKLLDVESLNAIRAALTTHQRSPRRLDCVANRRYQAEACDHNPTCQIKAPWRAVIKRLVISDETTSRSFYHLSLITYHRTTTSCAGQYSCTRRAHSGF